MGSSDTELIIATNIDPETDILVHSTDKAVQAMSAADGKVLTEPFDIHVGRVAIVQDPFDNSLALIDLPKGHFVTNDKGGVVDIAPPLAVK